MATSQEHINKKQYEVFLVIVAHAVINPRTVVIHSCNTTFTNRAMMWMRRLNRVALFALLRHNFVEEADVPCVDHNITLFLFLLGQWNAFFFNRCTTSSVNSFHDRLKCPFVLVLDPVRSYHCGSIRKFYSTIITHCYKKIVVQKVTYN